MNNLLQDENDIFAINVPLYIKTKGKTCIGLIYEVKSICILTLSK